MNDNTTIKVVLYSRRDKNNLYPVKIRLTKNRKSSFFNLGFSIEKKYWLKSTNRVSSSHPNSIDYNFQIEKKLKDLEGLKTSNIKNIIGSNSILNDLELKIENDYKNQYYTKKKYRTLYYHITKFWDKEDLRYSDINKSFFVGFRNYLQINIIPQDKLSNIPSDNTIGSYLKFFTTFLNEKKQEGVFMGDLDFVKKIIPKKIPSKVEPLSIDEIWVLDNLLPSNDFLRPLLFDSLNTFMFNFWTNGIRIGDCLRLKWGNIQGDVIVIRTGKTKRVLTIPLTSKNVWRLIWYMDNLPNLYDWSNREWFKGEDLEGFNLVHFVEKTRVFDEVVEVNWSNYIKYLSEYENFKDKNIDHPNYLLKDNNIHIRGGRYSVEYNNFVKSINKKIPLETLSKHKEILDYSLINSVKEYSRDEKNKNEYIFPFLKGYEKINDITKLSNKVSSSVSLINKSLKEVGKEVGFSKKLTNHLSRHSITSISKSLGTDIYDLKNMLGHTNVKQTEDYINSINTIQTSKLNTDKVSNFLDNI